MTADGTGFNSDEAQIGALTATPTARACATRIGRSTSGPAPDTALGFVCAPASGGTGPCGRQVHCAAAPVRQTAWDLVARDLVGAPFNLDSQTAFIVGNKLFYQGSGNIGAGTPARAEGPSDGCGATNGYMQWLAADDDNGNLNDGTPHMTAIFNAYNRHGIACATPGAGNSGCAGGPTGGADAHRGAPGNYSVGALLDAGPGRDALLGVPLRRPRGLQLRQGPDRGGARA